VKLRRVINGAKTITDAGSWKAGTKMPKTVFPLSRAGSFKVTSRFNWRVISFECMGEKFKLLVYYRTDIESFHADLGREVGGDMLVMARYEFHATHPGWHMHCLCDSTGKVAGRSGGTDRRMPRVGEFHKQCVFGVATDRQAYEKAVKIFRLDKRSATPFALT
jgi:hypothetical protein